MKKENERDKKIYEWMRKSEMGKKSSFIYPLFSLFYDSRA